jgi:nitroimidazol reductase NimA-like FMN-containing flavoprotein (pyridoxamine 5'-phosphate oxidase superfamily)
MSADYLAYLETSSAPGPSPGTVARLTAALGVPPAALSGAGLQLPPGQGGAGPHPALEVMTAEECAARLAEGGIGRFLFVTERGPVAVPVNYAMLGEDVVFRTDDRSAAAGTVGRQPVSFDVDHFDEALREGWSVLVSGAASMLTRPEDVREAEQLGIEPWAGGERDAYVRVVPAEVSGRRIRVRPAP